MPLVMSAKPAVEAMAQAIDDLLTQAQHLRGVFEDTDIAIERAIQSGDEALRMYHALRDGLPWAILITADGGAAWSKDGDVWEENPKLYEVVKQVCRDMGLPWSDPTGRTFNRDQSAD